MKVRIGIGLGVRTELNGADFLTVVDELERLKFDSLWLSERINGPAPDPLIASAAAVGRTTDLKLGTSVLVLPGRNPVVAAKEIASLAAMSGGRFLPAFGLGAVDPVEQRAFGVQRGERAKMFDEMLQIMRACWTGEPCTFDGVHYQVDNIRVGPVPERLDVWLGGIAESELRRIGRLGDGWLPSFVTPQDAEQGRTVIEGVLAEYGREIEEDHYGVLIPYANGPVPEALLANLAKRRPHLNDPSQLVPSSWEDLCALIEQFISVGTTKFVVLPMTEPSTADEWIVHLGELASTVLPLEREIA
ncbi:MAG: TIGR03854 family LLM class F420-dependent oxidoreductase [Ilumatobacteraceae bacterium]|nr:TIGR03854 family LLM class F420-dependent oxidoreductase [Ilumatobacteraceae bacterium]